MTMAHEIDFLADETMQELLAKEGLSPKDIFETQLLSIGAMAGSFVAKKLAHMEPPDEFVTEVFDELVVSAVAETDVGRAPTSEEGKKAVHTILHLLCAMNSLVSDMVDYKIIDAERAERTARKLHKIATEGAEPVDPAKHRVH